MVVIVGFGDPKFSLGRLCATQGAIDAGAGYEELMADFVIRHWTGDWGELCEEDKALNERALIEGGRIMSVYTLPTGQKVYVITEWDRSYTTVLLPSEY